MARKHAITVVAVAALALVPALSAAQGLFGGSRMKGQGRMGGPGFGAGFGGHMSAFLDLTEAQEAQIDEIRSAYKVVIEDLIEQRKTAREGLRDLATAETFDEGAVRLAAETIAAVDIELMVSHAKMKSEVHSILTEEQKAQLAEFKENLAERKGRRMGRGRGGRI